LKINTKIFLKNACIIQKDVLSLHPETKKQTIKPQVPEGQQELLL